ncbi:hypothetical protein GOBAR_DD01428 [Gossypium barbadense]|nr:hypothetical protein GOBAR_DD01428 [Gossypium barbadense]
MKLCSKQSTAKSKERKVRYIAELERKVQTLQTKATSLSAQLTLVQRDTNGLTAENSELKLRLQAMEQQVHLQDDGKSPSLIQRKSRDGKQKVPDIFNRILQSSTMQLASITETSSVRHIEGRSR